MNDLKEIRVMIVDDHDMVRRGLGTYLRVTPDIKVVGEASDGEQALAICQSCQPDVILMDLMMPRMGGVETTRRIRAHFPQVQVIALTSFKERELVQEMLREGAISYLLKNVTGEELVAAIRSAMTGRATLAPEVTQEFILSMQQPQPGDDLTEREHEVLILMVDGMSNPQIAERLNISRSTARAHVSNILSKLGVTNRSEAVSLALRKKLVK
ncbi:MAG TPA: response regulator transcription factor [Anaerolineaceae bacterium]|nr:response regulator transcription factor [Anaerolineaceae bacterium]